MVSLNFSIGDGGECKHKRGVNIMRDVDGLVGGKVVGRLEGYKGVPKKEWCQGRQ